MNDGIVLKSVDTKMQIVVLLYESVRNALPWFSYFRHQTKPEKNVPSCLKGKLPRIL